MAEWDVDLSEVNGLIRWYGKRPQMMQKASAMMLNNFAFGVRDEAVRQVDALMIVRNSKFVASRMRVTKTAMSTPIDKQRSIMGSMPADRFTGWKEQEKGTPTQRKRVAALASRKGDKHKQMIPRSRLKPSNEVINIESLTPKGGKGNLGGAVAILMRQKFKGLICIKGRFYMLPGKGQGFMGPGRMGPAGASRVATGLVRSLQLVQKMGKKQPKQKHWLRRARAIYFRHNPPDATWKRAVDRLITPPPKK